MRHCKRCGVEIAANMNRKYCLNCRAEVDAEIHARVNLAAGKKPMECRPYGIWMVEYLRLDRAEDKPENIKSWKIYEQSWGV